MAGEPIRILFIGDILGRSGRAVVLERLPKLIAEWKLDFVAINGENAAGGFGLTAQTAEEMFETGVPPYPVERTLLTSGMLDFLMESRFRGYKRVSTPELDVRYRVDTASHFCTVAR